MNKKTTLKEEWKKFNDFYNSLSEENKRKFSEEEPDRDDEYMANLNKESDEIEKEIFGDK